MSAYLIRLLNYLYSSDCDVLWIIPRIYGAVILLYLIIILCFAMTNILSYLIIIKYIDTVSACLVILLLTSNSDPDGLHRA